MRSRIRQPFVSANLSRAHWWLGTLAAVLAAELFASAAIAEVPTQSVISGNWKAIAESMSSNAEVRSPVERIILAHALLATNRDNLATTLLIETWKKEDIRDWQEWTEALRELHPENPNALFLSADAHARAGDMDGASALLSAAIENEEAFGLALMTRGVIRTLKGEASSGLEDLLAARKASPEMAAVHYNLGAYFASRRAAPGSVEAFATALELDPEFSLAHFGMGATQLGLENYIEAANSFELATTYGPCPPVPEIVYDRARAQLAEEEKLGTSILASTTGPGKRGGGVTRPPGWKPPPRNDPPTRPQPPPGGGNPPRGPEFPWPQAGPKWGPGPTPFPPDPTGPGGQGLTPGPPVPVPGPPERIAPTKSVQNPIGTRDMQTPNVVQQPSVSAPRVTLPPTIISPPVQPPVVIPPVRILAEPIQQPGGASTAELGQVSEDRGEGWLVTPPFSLLYQVPEP